MATEADKLKWEGKTTGNLVKHTAEEVWPLIEDFCRAEKLFPSIQSCYKVEEVEGVVRYCSFSVPQSLGGGGETMKWCYEKLVAVDPVGKCLSYQVMDNNLGIKANTYTATLKVKDSSAGCQIEWSFVADPIEGVAYADMCAFNEMNLQGMVKSIEKELEPST